MLYKRRHSHKNKLAYEPQEVVGTTQEEYERIVDTAFYQAGSLRLIGSTTGHKVFEINMNTLRLCLSVRELVLSGVKEVGRTGLIENNSNPNIFRGHLKERKHESITR